MLERPSPNPDLEIIEIFIWQDFKCEKKTLYISYDLPSATLQRSIFHSILMETYAKRPADMIFSEDFIVGF